jgi:hypothetical protein
VASSRWAEAVVRGSLLDLVVGWSLKDRLGDQRGGE